MRVIDPGHEYVLNHLDGNGEQRLVFVKREGEGYPGNVGSHEGTTMQEVLRALIHRAKYVQNQIPCTETYEAISSMRDALYRFEMRAARRHGRDRVYIAAHYENIESEPICEKCGHVGCGGNCRAPAIESTERKV